MRKVPVCIKIDSSVRHYLDEKAEEIGCTLTEVINIYLNHGFKTQTEINPQLEQLRKRLIILNEADYETEIEGLLSNQAKQFYFLKKHFHDLAACGCSRDSIQKVMDLKLAWMKKTESGDYDEAARWVKRKLK